MTQGHFTLPKSVADYLAIYEPDQNSDYLVDCCFFFCQSLLARTWKITGLFQEYSKGRAKRVPRPAAQVGRARLLLRRVLLTCPEGNGTSRNIDPTFCQAGAPEAAGGSMVKGIPNDGPNQILVRGRSDCWGCEFDRDFRFGNRPAQITGSKAEPQQIVAQVLLSCLQYPLP